jgi:hypothetical protein
LAAWDPASGILINGVTVVTMDDQHTVIPHGGVLVRDGRIVAIWRGPTPPDGVVVGDASVVEAGPQDLVFPGLINLHSHPRENNLHVWPAPSAHAIPAQGKAGADPSPTAINGARRARGRLRPSSHVSSRTRRTYWPRT